MGYGRFATILFANHLGVRSQGAALAEPGPFVVFERPMGRLLLYAAASTLTGYGPATLDEIRNFRQWGARTAGQPGLLRHLEGRSSHDRPLGRAWPMPSAWQWAGRAPARGSRGEDGRPLDLMFSSPGRLVLDGRRQPRGDRPGRHASNWAGLGGLFFDGQPDHHRRPRQPGRPHISWPVSPPAGWHVAADRRARSRRQSTPRSPPPRPNPRPSMIALPKTHIALRHPPPRTTARGPRRAETDPDQLDGRPRPPMAAPWPLRGAGGCEILVGKGLGARGRRGPAPAWEAGFAKLPRSGEIFDRSFCPSGADQAGRDDPQAQAAGAEEQAPSWPPARPAREALLTAITRG